MPAAALLFFLFFSVAGGVRFDFSSLTLSSLTLLGDAHLKNGTVRLTRDLAVPFSAAGRALYADAVSLAVPFSTFFSFSVSLLNPSSSGGGLAFLLASDDKTVGDAGGFLGVCTAAARAGDAAAAVAVEFDTFLDEQFGDVSANHVGIDVNSMVSKKMADLDDAGIDLKSGETVNAWVDYTDAKLLQVSVSYSSVKPAKPLLAVEVNLAEVFSGGLAFVGFAAATQGSTEAHNIEWWSFSSPSPLPARTAPVSLPAASPPPSSPATTQGDEMPPSAPSPEESIAATKESNEANALRMPSQGAVAGAATAGAFVAAASLAGVLFCVLSRRRARMVSRRRGLCAASEIAQAPREFRYKELAAATRNFDAARVIGHGAFGTVYKGILPDTGAIVAVKRCINSGAGGGSAEFMSELSIIAGLRHRHLVKLQGWCSEKGEILLVYDYMQHGSLDRALFDAGDGAPPFPWRHRRDALLGVASALAYLHRECERCVIHRDIKSSNVMLDGGYRARLGDFGLARTTEHGASPDATAAAGTMGYLAPEYLLSGRATEASDVFSFGALALEVACGRRPIDGEGRFSNLVHWVWALHGEGRILDAVDRRLGGEFDEEEARRVLLVGLACSSPDPAMRPGMRAVVQVLSGDAEPPFVPAARPSMSFSASNQQLLMNLQDSVSDYNELLGLTLSGYSSSFSSSTSLRSAALRCCSAAGGSDLAVSAD